MFSCFATTISLFLHTLKFKGYIGPKTSFSLYVISYMLTFYSMVKMADLFFMSKELVVIAAVGMMINRFAPSQNYFTLYQILAMAALLMMRDGVYRVEDCVVTLAIVPVMMYFSSKYKITPRYGNPKQDDEKISEE